MSEAEANRLLAVIEAARRKVAAAAEERDAAILAAFNAGIPRDDIAKAAKVTRVRVYQIVDRLEHPPAAP